MDENRLKRLQSARAILQNSKFLQMPEQAQLLLLKQLLEKGLSEDDLRLLLNETSSVLLAHFPAPKLVVEPKKSGRKEVPKQKQAPKQKQVQPVVTPQRVYMNPQAQVTLKNNAAEVCARLLTRALKELTEEQEELVTDYLYSIGINIEADISSRDMCLVLLEKLMIDEYGNKVPVTAFANNILEKAKKASEIRAQQVKAQQITYNRALKEKELKQQTGNMLGCEISNTNIFSKIPYKLVIDPTIRTDVNRAEEAEGAYSAVILLSTNLYNELLLNFDSPLLEIVTLKGARAYVRVQGTYESSNDDHVIHITPLVAEILELDPNVKSAQAFVKLCNALAEISFVEFRYYGTQEELNGVLQQIQEILPSIINRYSYLSLGMVFKLQIPDNIGVLNQHEVRVDRIYDTNKDSIYAGIIPQGDVAIEFEIFPDQ